MATQNDTPKAYIHSLTLDMSGQDPRELRSTAISLMRAVELALFVETPGEALVLEAVEHASLHDLLVAARSMLASADQIDQAERKPLAA